MNNNDTVVCPECGHVIQIERDARMIVRLAKVLSFLVSCVLVAFLAMSTVNGNVIGQTLEERMARVETHVEALAAVDARNTEELKILREQTLALTVNVNRVVGTAAALGALLVLLQVIDYIAKRRGRRERR